MSNQRSIPTNETAGQETFHDPSITVGYLQPDQTLPLVIRPAVEGLDLVTWASSRRDVLETLLLRHGALLFRDFNIQSSEEFGNVITATTGAPPLEYTERSSPRTEMGHNIYTSTDYPPDQVIFLHNEHSYNTTFPLKIFFFCLIPAEQGGETPIANTRKVYTRIDPAIRERFRQKGYMYVRNFNYGFGLTWQTAFQTSDKAKVEEYCRRANIECEWKEQDRLRTRQVRPVIAVHPRTGELSWFNHATLFNVSSLPQIAREALLSMFKEDEVPNNTFYGDGSPIEPEVLDDLRAAYQQELVSFPWQKGDVMMLDNVLTSHGRSSYVGPRKVLVGMAEPCSWNDAALK